MPWRSPRHESRRQAHASPQQQTRDLYKTRNLRDIGPAAENNPSQFAFEVCDDEDHPDGPDHDDEWKYDGRAPVPTITPLDDCEAAHVHDEFVRRILHRPLRRSLFSSVRPPPGNVVFFGRGKLRKKQRL